MADERDLLAPLREMVANRGQVEHRPSYATLVVVPSLVFLAVFTGLLAAGAVLDGGSGALAVLIGLYVGAAEAAALGGTLGLLVALLQVALVVFSVAIAAAHAKLIARRNAHFERDQGLRVALLRIAGPAARRAKQPTLLAELDAMVAVHEEMSARERPRRVAAHAIAAFFVFPWYLYVWSFLLREPQAHAERQARFTEQASRILGAVRRPLPAPPTAGRYHWPITCLFVLGLPGVGWLIVGRWLWNGLGVHQDEQARFEEAMLEAIRGQQRKRPAAEMTVKRSPVTTGAVFEAVE